MSWNRVLRRRAASRAMLAVALASTMSAGCFVTGECSNWVRSDLLSPDEDYGVSVVQRNCGATTDYSTIVAMRYSDDPLDFDTDSIVLALDGKADVRTTWKSNRELVIRYAPAEASTKIDRWKDITIVFEPEGEPSPKGGADAAR